VAERLLDEEAYHNLIQYRQRFNIQYDDGTTGVITSDRVQIILGNAIESSLASAKRYGATLKFGTDDVVSAMEESDIVALFAGAHTSEVFPELKPEMGIHSWPDINSDCKMWLRIKESEQEDFFCTRGGEVGAEHWHYTIESARNTIDDIVRIRNCLISQNKRSLRKLEVADEEEKQKVIAQHEAQMKQLDDVQKAIEGGKTPTGRFDYIFTNAPSNPHNLEKRDEAAKDGSIVLEGGYCVELKLASNSKCTSKEVLDKFNTSLVVCGGDACVPPNPQAAYGATLATEAADMLVQLAVSIGHLNSILEDMEKISVGDKWIEEVKELKTLLSDFYNARGRSENYFQFVQTLICNLYSLPAFTA
jgi:hypothetical protein